MKKSKDNEMTDELRPEYDMRELLKGDVRGKYVGRVHVRRNLVSLDPDVAQAFPNEQAVNDALRLVIQLTQIPEKRKRAKV